MRKLRFALILPLAHLIFSAIVLRNFIHFRYLTQLWFAINGPVVILVDTCKYIASLPLVGPWITEGALSVELLFLIGGFALWYLAGRAIDGLLCEKSSRQHMPAFVSASREFLLIASGVYLAFHGLRWILPAYPGQHQAIHSIVDGIIILLWSLVLVLGPGWTLLNRLRFGHLRSNPD